MAIKLFDAKKMEEELRKKIAQRLRDLASDIEGCNVDIDSFTIENKVEEYIYKDIFTIKFIDWSTGK